VLKIIFLRLYTIILDEVFVISRIIKVDVGVISQSRRLRLITLTETLIILDITKTESNNCVIIHWTKKMKVMFLLHHWRQATQSTWTWHDHPWPWVSLTWLLYNLQRWRHKRWFRKFTVRFWPIRKEIVSSMYNDTCTMPHPNTGKMLFTWWYYTHPSHCVLSVSCTDCVVHCIFYCMV